MPCMKSVFPEGSSKGCRSARVYYVSILFWSEVYFDDISTLDMLNPRFTSY